MPKGIYKRTSEMKTGQHMLGKKLSKKWKNSLSIALKGNKNGFKKGDTPWNKGLTKESDKRISQYAQVLKGRKLSEKHRKKLSEAHLGQKISEKCKRKNRELCKKRIGELNPNFGKKLSIELRKKISDANKGERGNNWKGGITSKNNRLRHSIETKLWRESVFLRDNWICQKCKKRGGIILHPHHIHNFSEKSELRFAIDNGITFCKGCHEKFHRIYGRTNNNEEQVKNFLKKKIVYVYLCGDIIHIGHLIFLKKAKEQGEILIAGVLTDSAICEKKPKPIISFKERLETVKAIKYVDKAISQFSYSPLSNVQLIKPDILVESDSHVEMPANDFVKSYGGKVVILKYYRPQSSTLIKTKIKKKFIIAQK